jgi:nitrate/nitrite transport system substrate-binding protein
VCEILSQGRYVNAPQEILEKSMLGTFQFDMAQEPKARADFNVFSRYSANFPWRSHALWFLTQMVRWGQIQQPLDLRKVAERVYRPELYRKAAASLGVALPEHDYKDEGLHDTSWNTLGKTGPIELGADRFFDDKVFSAADPIGYLQGLEVKKLAVSLDELKGVNKSAPQTALQRKLGGKVTP